MLSAMMLAMFGASVPSTAESVIDASQAESPAELELPAKTVVEIEITDTVSSRTAKVGDMFAIRLAEPVKVNGRLVLPIGLIGRGEVSHVAKAGWGGKPGELIVMVRYLECGPDRIPIGHFHLGASGEAHIGAALGASMIVPLAGLFIDGGDMILQAGTLGNAKVSSAIGLPGGDPPCSISSK